jgi:hypothetical protein
VKIASVDLLLRSSPSKLAFPKINKNLYVFFVSDVFQKFYVDFWPYLEKEKVLNPSGNLFFLLSSI